MNDSAVCGTSAAPSRFERIVSGEASGALAVIARAVLAVLSLGYRLVIAVRNAWYDAGRGVRHPGAPVISVGNITVGGTGKTPMTVWLAQYLATLGLTPAVLSRGYKAADRHAADELALIRRRCPASVTVADSDRVAAARRAVADHAADLLVLDDGFQHRRLARDLDLVLIDATCPFGYGRLLPRGLLREPLPNLRRAGVIVITRADQVAPAALDNLRDQLARLAPGAPILRAVHRIDTFTTLTGDPAPAPPAARLLLFAGIARPTAFERSMRDAGYLPAATCWFDDHHTYTAADLAALERRAAETHAEFLVTTEKDAVKLAALNIATAIPLRVVRVAFDFLDDDATILARRIRDLLPNREPREESNARSQSPAR
jgi:tetraacyldisaccharide 4'-kinase